MRPWGYLFLAFMMVAGLGSPAPAGEREANYVVFTIMGLQALEEGPKIVLPEVPTEAFWNPQEREAVEEMKRQFGEQRPGQARYVGFSVWLPTLNLTPAQLKGQVNLALDLAERNKIPVFFHLDDQHMWWRSPDLSRNPEMVEWSGFPPSGQKSGPVLPRYWLDWGTPPSVYPAPPPCFACSPFRAAMAKRLREYIAEPIIERLQRWRKSGLDYLFAGVATGNETSVPDYSDGLDGYPKNQGDPEGLERGQQTLLKVKMSKAEMVPVGYHSLYAMGYTRQSLERLAQSQGKTVNKIAEELFYKVAHDYAEFQARTLNEAGLPRDHIYTHFTSSARTLWQGEPVPPSSKGGSGNVPPPFVSAINQYSRPGFTIVRDGVDLNKLSSELSAAHAPDGGKAWAVVESYACTGQPGPPQTQKQYEDFLGGLFSHGAKVVNCYGWNIHEGPYAVKASGVIPAVSRWLAGAQISTTWFKSAETEALSSNVHSRLAQIQAMAHKLVDSGHDPRQIKEILDLTQEADPLFKSGKSAEGLAVLDRAIARLQALMAH